MSAPSLAVLSEAGSVSPSGRSTRGSHQLAAVSACERMWWLRYIHRIVPDADKPFRRKGTLIHLCLAYHYASKMPEATRPRWFYEKDLQTALEEKGRGVPAEIQLAKEILFVYREWFPDSTETWVPRHIEEEFLTTIGEIDPGGPDSTLDPEVISCRPDLIVETFDALLGVPVLWIVDYKSRGKAWGKNTDRLETWSDENEFKLDWQVLFNLHIVRKRLAPRIVAGFIIQRLKRDAPYDFDRHVLVIPGAAYNEAPRTARAYVAGEREVKQRVAMGQKPVPSFLSCYGRYGPCDYRDICAAPTKERSMQIMRERYVKEER